MVTIYLPISFITDGPFDSSKLDELLDDVNARNASWVMKELSGLSLITPQQFLLACAESSVAAIFLAN